MRCCRSLTLVYINRPVAQLVLLEVIALRVADLTAEVSEDFLCTALQASSAGGQASQALSAGGRAWLQSVQNGFL